MGPLGPIQSVLMTSCLALLFLFLFASLLEEVIVHSSWYVLHISLLASLKNQDTKYKGFGWSIVKPLNCCPKTKDIGFSLLAGADVGGNGRKIWGVRRLGGLGQACQTAGRRWLTLAQFWSPSDNFCFLLQDSHACSPVSYLQCCQTKHDPSQLIFTINDIDASSNPHKKYKTH